jgi:hypothetical protein
MTQTRLTNENWGAMRTEFITRTGRGEAPAAVLRDLRVRYLGIGPKCEAILMKAVKESWTPVPIARPPVAAPVAGPDAAPVVPPVADMKARPVLPNPNAGVKLAPKIFTLHGRDNYYQLPNGRAKGLVAVFPGCSRAATGFWPWVAGDPVGKKCTGFPEDVSHTKQILNRGYAILVLTPSDRSLCWTSTTTNISQPVEAIKRFQTKFGLDSSSLFVLGVSSGGGFAARMADLIHVDGAILEVSTNSTAPGPKTPQTVWVTMGAEETTKAQGYARSLGTRGAVVRSPPRTLGLGYFSDYFDSITPTQSAQMVDALRRAGFLDAAGMLVKDPKENKAWVKALAGMAWLKTPGTTASAAVRSSPVLQSLTAAYARHEHVATYTTAALTWFESGARADFAKIAKDLAVTRPTTL